MCIITWNSATLKHWNKKCSFSRPLLRKGNGLGHLFWITLRDLSSNLFLLKDTTTSSEAFASFDTTVFRRCTQYPRAHPDGYPPMSVDWSVSQSVNIDRKEKSGTFVGSNIYFISFQGKDLTACWTWFEWFEQMDQLECERGDSR